MRMPPEELARRFAEGDRARVMLRRASEDLRKFGRLLAACGRPRETRDADIAVVDADAGAIASALAAALAGGA